MNLCTACHIRHCISVVRETLESRGVLGQLKARIRAEVFNALDDPADSRPRIPSENVIINELILDYLEFNKYNYAASVLQAGKLQPLLSLIADYNNTVHNCGLKQNGYQ